MELFSKSTKNEFARIEESNGITIMKHQMWTLEFHLVEKRTKNKCPCVYSIPKCPKPCRKRIQYTERIIGFWPKQTSKGNLNKIKKKQDQNYILTQNVQKLFSMK